MDIITENVADEPTEPLLTGSWKRLVLFPIEHDTAWKLYKKSVACFWTPEEIDLSKDVVQYNALPQHERYLIGNVLAFFAASDGIIMENLAENFLTEVQWPEVRAFYSFQIFMEIIHSETYSQLINTFYQDTAERNCLLEAIIHNRSVAAKANWAMTYVRDKTRPFNARILAFTCVEMIFFCGSFAVIFWVKSRGLLPGLTFSNELISRDESQHVEFGCWLYLQLANQLDSEEVYRIVNDAVEVELQFWRDAFFRPLIGLNTVSMQIYIKFVADLLLKMLHLDPIYNAYNPFPFMETISLEGKSNFFERRVSEYRKANVGCGVKDLEFSTDADF